MSIRRCQLNTVLVRITEFFFLKRECECVGEKKTGNPTRVCRTSTKQFAKLEHTVVCCMNYCWAPNEITSNPYTLFEIRNEIIA